MSRSKHLIAILGLTLVGNLSAQRIAFGIRGGLLASTDHATRVRTGIIPGATAGIYVPYHAGARFEIEPGIMLTVGGSSYMVQDGDKFVDRTYYLQVPLSFKLFLGNEFNLSGGVQMGKRLAVHRSENGEKSDVGEKYKSMDVGLHGGIGMDLNSGVDIGLRYYSGMIPLLLNDDAIFPKNRSVQLTVGYRLMHFREINTSYRKR